MTRQSPNQYRSSVLEREKVDAHFWMLSGCANCPAQTQSSVFEKVVEHANREEGRSVTS